MSGLDGVALVIGIFFLIGIAVGWLTVMAIPVLVRILAAAHYRDRLDDDGWDPPGMGPPRNDPPPTGRPNEREPDDRDGRPWWGEAG